MKRRAFLASLLTLPFARRALGQINFLDAQGAPGSVPPLADLFIENFESSGYDNASAWTESAGGGTINKDYTANPLSGGQSLNLIASSQSVTTYATFAAQSSCAGYMLFYRNSSSSNYRLFSLRTSAGVVVAQFVLDNNQKLTVRAGSGTSVVMTDAVPQSTLVHLRWEYTAGGGGNAFAAVEFSTNGVFAGYNGGANTKYVRDTAGNATGNAARLMLGSDTNTGYNNIFDKVLVATSVANLHP